MREVEMCEKSDRQLSRCLAEVWWQRCGNLAACTATNDDDPPMKPGLCSCVINPVFSAASVNSFMLLALRAAAMLP